MGFTKFSNMVMGFVLLVVNAVSVDAQGSWQLLVAKAGIATMHAAVTHHNTVILLDRTNIGPSQLNLPDGVCRDNPQDQMSTHDCTAHSAMYDIASNSIRPLFIYTDTWCSSGAFLPDGTLLQTGGEAEGINKIRKLTPCPGNGNCDWVETNDALADGRWYATDQLLPDGRVIVVGGRGVVSYEFVPGGGGSTYLPLLAETGGDNLYPYVHLMPNGNLFILANRDSVELDYNTNNVVRKFPTLPGEPRNYPSAGSSVLLPLLASDGYTKAEVMVCGGSQAGAFSNPGAQYTASVTCGRIEVSSANPGWAMSNMPMPRNMGDMILLPSAEVLIINGAGKGSQGYGEASAPVLTPVIYRVDKGSFSVLKGTDIPRVYHSTASLLPDGRILVAGSNTHFLYTFEGDLPTELRIQAFSPPYLGGNWNAQRPQIDVAPDHVKYGETFTVTFKVNSAVKGLEMNLVSSPFTTHSISMGSRLLKLKVGKVAAARMNKYTVQVTAPPNGNLAPASYYMLFPVMGGIPGTAAWIRLTN